MLTEKEKVQRARMYMWKLQEGIDPITNESTRDSMLNNERLKKCFRYVYDVLSMTLQHMDALEKFPEYNLEKKKKRRESSKKPKSSTYFTEDELKRVVIFASGCRISEFVGSINKAIAGSGRKKLEAKQVNNWLVYKGYLCNRVDLVGHKHRELTDRSREIGLRSRKRKGSSGEYTQIIYSKKAQEYILDNIEEIFGFRGKE